CDILLYFLSIPEQTRDRHLACSYPTRRSSDLAAGVRIVLQQAFDAAQVASADGMPNRGGGEGPLQIRVEPLELRRVRELVGQLRSEEHTSELQSRENLVCRLLLEQKRLSF